MGLIKTEPISLRHGQPRVDRLGNNKASFASTPQLSDRS